MSETLRDLVVRLSLNSDNFTRNIKSINKQIQEAQSNFQLAAAGVENFENTTVGLSAKLSTLERTLKLQQDAVGQYEKALTQANSKLRECYNRQNDYAQRLVDAKNHQSALKEEVRQAADAYKQYVRNLGESDSATIAVKANLDALKGEYREAVQEVKLLQGQNVALAKATQNAADAVSSAQTKFNGAQAAIKQTSADIDKCSSALKLSQTQWESAGETIQQSQLEIVSIGKQMKLAESTFKLASAGVKDFDQSTAGLTERLTLLNERQRLQTQAVAEYQTQLAAAQQRLAAAQAVNDPEKIRHATDAVTDARAALNNANAALKITGVEIQDTNEALAISRTNWQSAGDAMKQNQLAISSIGKQMREVDSFYRSLIAGSKEYEQSTAGLTLKVNALNEKYRLQTEAIAQYQAQLDAAQQRLAAAQSVNDPEKIQQATDAVTDARTALNEAAGALRITEAEIKDTNDALALSKTQWNSAATAITQSQQRIASIGKEMREVDSFYRSLIAGSKEYAQTTAGLNDKLSALNEKYHLQSDTLAEYKNQLAAAKEQLQAAQAVNEPEKIRQATDAVTDAYTALNEATAAMRTMEAEIEETNEALALSQTSWESAEKKIKQTEQAITSIGKQLKLAESRFKLAAAGVKDFDKSAAGLTAKLTLLHEKQQLQTKAIEEYERQLAAAKEQFRAAQAVMDDEKIRQATDAVTDAETALTNAKAELKQTRAEIEKTNKELKTAQSAWTAAGKSMESFGKKCDQVGQSMSKAGLLLTTTMTTPIVALGATAIKASLDFESSFASVRKTVDATEAEFDDLAASSKRMSTQIATSTDEINEVMATGGQLGIANEHLQSFTRTMIDLGNSCEDLDATEAASTIAKFANVMGTNQALFQNIGSTIVELGNNFATTEEPIMTMAQRLAGAGKQVGLTEPQVLGFAAALSSVGIEAEMGGSAFSKALIKMEVACATGGEALDDFGKVCGMTGEQFKALFETDPAAAFEAFIVGLSKMDEEGESAIAVLNEIGIVEVRLRDTLLRSVNATELFAKAQKMANEAWEENTALTEEANKRYATTESKLKNLKNTALLFGQQIGDDLNPTIQELIASAEELLNSFLEMDESQRKQIIQFAAYAAAAGPVILITGKLTTGIGKAATGIGKFATAVGKAGGGFKGFMSVLGKSPSVWLAVAAAVVVGTIALADYVSGAKEAREALEGMNETAEKWKNNAADTFYSQSEGLSFFGMSKEDFVRDKGNAEEWLNGLIAVWTDGQKESDEIVTHWTESFKKLTGATREALLEMKETADAGGYTSVSDDLAADLAQLDAIDAEIERLLKRRQNGYFSEKDKIRLQELIDTREAIEVRYHLSPADVDGFDTIRQKLEAEVARAHALGKQDADVSIYENAMVAAAEGLAAINAEVDAQYDKEYAVIQLIEDSAERQAALDELNSRYTADRLAAAREYAETLSGIVMPVWEQENIQQATSDMDQLVQLLRQYQLAMPSERPAILTQMEELSAAMDESSMTEYIALLTQIQSLMDSGMSESEIQAMFPEIDFSTALEQIASIQSFLNNREIELPGLTSMFGDALPEEVLKIATDLDMTGAQTRWDEFASNPGAITTEAIIASISENEETVKVQPQVDAFIAKYTEVPEGADKATLTPTGIVAYVTSFAEATTGVDVSGLNPTNVTAMVTAYNELAEGADISTLKPGEIVAYINKYLEAEGVDTSGLSPDAVTAFVLAYQEITGGALTTALTPSDVVAFVAKYLEAEGVDLSALSPDQIEGIVTSFAEALNCDKSTLLRDFTAYITAYDDSGATVPTLEAKVGIYGYDLLAYRKFIQDNPVEVAGILKLSEVYEDPTDAAGDENTRFWKDGVEIPASMVTPEMLTADRVAVLAEDGTMHILITPQVTGTQEAIDAIKPVVDEVDQFGVTVAGMWAGLVPTTTMDMVGSAVERLNSYTNSLDYNGWQRFWASLRGESTDKGVLNQSMTLDFPADRVAELSTYVAEVVSAIQQGKQVSEADIQNLQKILTFLQGLDTHEVGTHILEGIGVGMTAAGWDTDAETVATNLEVALNLALGIQSPSTRVKPVGSNVSAGVGVGMTEYDFTADAATIATSLNSTMDGALTSTLLSGTGTTAMGGLASAMSSYSFVATGASVSADVKSAVSANLTGTTLRSVGVNAMGGLKAGINAGRSGVISAMRSAARAAVNAAKSELKIKSPSQVFEDEVGVMAMRGFGVGALKESKEQARVLRNASRYLTDAAREGSIAYSSNDNRKTYNTNQSVNLTVQNMQIRDEQDIRSLAVEIATLTRRQQRGLGLRMA